MKALTISQPYASLIADGEKPVENRRWYTPYRGPLAIHAGKGTQYLARDELELYPTGCVIATCHLISCVELTVVLRNGRRPPNELVALGWNASHMNWLVQHEHTEGPFCWVLSGIRKLVTPVPATGKQGLWDWKENQHG